MRKKIDNLLNGLRTETSGYRINTYGEAKLHKITTSSNMAEFGDYIVIGSLGTKVKTRDFDRIDWSSARKATRSLMSLLFTRKTLATFSLPYKYRTEFLRKTNKPELDPIIIEDIIECVMREVEFTYEDSIVETMIVVCADQCKLLRIMKKHMNKEQNK